MAVTYGRDITDKGYANLRAQAERLAQLFAGGIGSGWARGTQGYDTGRGGDNGPELAYGYVNPEFQRLAESIGLGNKQSLVGPYGLNAVYGPDAYETFAAGDNGMMQRLREGAAPSAYTFTTGEMKHPDREGKSGAYSLTFNPDGTLRGVDWTAYEQHKGFLGENMSWLGPLLVGGLAALGAGAGGAAAGTAAPIVESTPSWAAPGALSTGTIGGANASLGSLLGIPTGAAGTAMNTGLVSMAPGVGSGLSGLMSGTLGVLPEFGAGFAAQAPVAAQSAALGGAPISQSAPTWTAPQSKVIADSLGLGGGTMETLRTLGSVAGPAMSLLSGGAQLGSLPQQPADAPRLPGIEAPPEARGFQAGVAPILDVLGRNKRDGRNRTLLTGPRGVNMESTRARGNSLLGL